MWVCVFEVPHNTSARPMVQDRVIGVGSMLAACLVVQLVLQLIFPQSIGHLSAIDGLTMAVVHHNVGVRR